MASIIFYEVFTLLRHICEINPRKQTKQTKGGYLQGKIKLPRVKGKLRMEIQTVSADVDPYIADIHPCLVHVVRLGGPKKRQQHLEPTPSKLHWKQIFEIEDGKVKIMNRFSDHDTKLGTVPEVDEVSIVQGGSILLGGGKGMLNLILLQPNQKKSKESNATIYNVIENRLHPANRDLIRQKEDKFIKKPKNLKRIRLKVEFYTENGQKCGSALSPVISDSKDKDVGIIKFYDATPLIGCVNGGRKVVMISEFELANDVVPIFQVHDCNGIHRQDLDQYLTQPREFKIKKLSIIFITPLQENFQDIENSLDSFMIKLVVKRKWDGYTSETTFDFTFENHDPIICSFCDFNIDSDKSACIEQDLPRAGPGCRRHERNDFRQNKNGSSMSTSTISGESGIFSNTSDENDEHKFMNMDECNSGIQVAVSGQLNLSNLNVSNETPLMLDLETYQSQINGTHYKEYKPMSGTSFASAGITDDNFDTLCIFEDIVQPLGYCDGVESRGTPPNYQTITNEVELNSPKLLEWRETTIKEDMTDTEAKHFIFEDGTRYPKNDKKFDEQICQDGHSARKELSSSTGPKGKIAIGTTPHPEKISGNEVEPCCNRLNNFAENFLLENIPFLSFCFMIFLMVCQAAVEVAEELQVDGFICFSVSLACLILFIKLKIISIYQK